jgi:ribosomal protein S18 acetylase RimI-like enzyme
MAAYRKASDRHHPRRHALMNAAKCHAYSRGAVTLFLLTGHTNGGAQAFYSALGYTDYALALHKPLP